MKSKKFFQKMGAFIAALLLCHALPAAEPLPVYDGLTAHFSPPQFEQWSEKFNHRLLSVSSELKFNKPVKADLGFFQCELQKDGTLLVTLFPGKTELMPEPIVLRSKDKIKPGEKFDLAINFSAERRRYSLYINGKWQTENAVFVVPETLEWKQPNLKDFPGEVTRFIVYDASLESEDLTPSDKTAVEFDNLAARATETSSKAQSAELKKWCQELSKRALALKRAKPSIGAWKRLERDIANAEKIAATPTFTNQCIAVYELPPSTQELYTPYALPQSGNIDSKLQIFAAKGENKPVSVMVVPFAPVKQFTVRFTDLKNEKGNVFSAENIDRKLVKRWYRAGGWMNYFRDQHQRLLVPDLLLNDDKLLKVDEIRQINYLRLNYPSGELYADVSKCEYEQRSFCNAPVMDAKSLLPLELPEAGRNQQYMFRVCVPKDAAEGIYRGTLEYIADGKTVLTQNVELRILPFVLPEAKTYYDITRTYFSHINSVPECNPELFRNLIKLLLKYNYKNASGVVTAPWKVQICREMGYPLNEIMQPPLPNADTFYKPWGAGMALLTDRDIQQLDKIYIRKMKLELERIGLPESTVFYPCFSSESDIYRVIKEVSDHPADVMHANTNIKRFSHSMTDRFIVGAIDSSDMDSSSHIYREWADIWHAAGGRVLNYGEPFPGAENPGWFRRKMGLEMYKANYDGHMMHGLVSRHWNEFSDWPEDPAYKNFGMAYPAHNSVIEKLALVGAADAFTDVCYATELKTLAMPRLNDANALIRKTAKRDLAWLEKIDGKTYDMDAFRVGCALRIVNLINLIKTQEGK